MTTPLALALAVALVATAWSGVTARDPSSRQRSALTGVSIASR